MQTCSLYRGKRVKINTILHDPQGSLDYMERYVNDGSPSGFTFVNSTSYDTCPNSEKKTFNLYRVIYPREWGITIGVFPSVLKDSSVTSFYDSLLIHPDCVCYFDELEVKETDLCVVPTSSARTVRMLDFNYYLKLNYFGIIGRIKRNLTINHALASYEITNILNNLIKKEKYDRLCFLPESSAKIILNPCEKVDAGIVVRDCQQVGKSASRIEYKIPFFSLFSTDKKMPSDKPLLIQLINLHREDPIDFILKEIIFPIIDCYFELIIDEGLEPEWHAQNLLLGLDKNMKIQSFIMRDLESIDVDEEMRLRAGKKTPLSFYPYKHINSNQYNYQIKHSFMYDFKLCKYLIEPIIICICKEYNLNLHEIINNVRFFANTKIESLPADFFPQDWYSFKNVLINQERSARPYINNGPPIYRSNNQYS